MKRLFNGNTDIIEIIIRDGTGGKIESRMANLSDSKSMNNILDWLKKKYNVGNSVGEVDWLSLDSEFIKF